MRPPAKSRSAIEPSVSCQYCRSAHDPRHELKRYFGFAQFKRSALPNGPKVVAGGSLSPRGDWRAPSDAEAVVWLDELRRNVPD